MAISCKPSVLPSVPFGCVCTSDTCVAVELGDTTSVQIGLTPIEASNLITNGTFDDASGWTLGGSFAISGGTANTTGGVGTLSRPLDYPLTAGYYKISMTFGGSGVPITQVVLGGQTASQITVIVALVLQEVNIFVKVLAPSDNLILFSKGATGDIAIDNLVIQKLSEVEYNVRDCDTEEIFYTGEATTYFETGNLSFVGINKNQTVNDEGMAQIDIVWADLGISEGCYCICYNDIGLLGFEYVKNGTFATADFWDITNTGATGWSIAAGVAQHVAIAPPGDDLITQDLGDGLNPGICYDFTFDTIAAGAWSVEMVFQSFGYGGSHVFSGTGNQSNSYILQGGFFDEPVISFYFNAVGGLGAYSIDNVSIKPSDTCVDCACVTMCISLKESHDNTIPDTCNMLLQATNANDALGYNFTYFTLTHKMRVFGKLRNAGYDFTNEEFYKKSNGDRILVSSGYEKFKELQIFQMPEAMHDMLSLMIIHQTFTITIDGVEREFVKRPGSLSPIWDKRTGDAPVTIELAEKTQDYFNYLV